MHPEGGGEHAAAQVPPWQIWPFPHLEAASRQVLFPAASQNQVPFKHWLCPELDVQSPVLHAGPHSPPRQTLLPQLLPAQQGCPRPPHAAHVPPRHTPAVHLSPAQQGWFTPPQAAQFPAEQIWLLLQREPPMSTHVRAEPSQAKVPGTHLLCPGLESHEPPPAHGVMHWVPMQTFPPPHATPPQLLSAQSTFPSQSSSAPLPQVSIGTCAFGTQRPLQSVSPAAHLPSQGAPAAAQVVPHFLPPGQSKSHFPAAQIARPAPGAAHFVQVVPQASGSLFDLQVLPQAWKPSLQRIAHVVALVQVATPLSLLGHGEHCVPHEAVLLFGKHLSPHW